MEVCKKYNTAAVILTFSIATLIAYLYAKSHERRFEQQAEEQSEVLRGQRAFENLGKDRRTIEKPDEVQLQKSNDEIVKISNEESSIAELQRATPSVSIQINQKPGYESQLQHEAIEQVNYSFFAHDSSIKHREVLFSYDGVQVQQIQKRLFMFRGQRIVQVKQDIYTVSEQSLEVVHYQNITSIPTATRLASLGTQREFFAAVNYCDEAICITGGLADWCDSVQFFHLNKNEWQRGPQLTVSRQQHASCTQGRKIYVIGGNDGRTDLDSIDCLDLAALGDIETSKWQRITRNEQFACRKRPAFCALDSNTLIIMGGFRKFSQKLSDVWLFDTRTNKAKNVIENVKENVKENVQNPFTCLSQTVVIADKVISLVEDRSKTIRLLSYDPESNNLETIANFGSWL